MRQLRVLAVGALSTLLALTIAPSWAQQKGYYVLDGFGGVHAGGGAPAVTPQTPYFGFDAAEDIVYVPTGSGGRDGVVVLDAFGGLWPAGEIAADSLDPRTPYFGFDIARGIAVRDIRVSEWQRIQAYTCQQVAAHHSGFTASCPFGRKLTGGGVQVYTNNICTFTSTEHSITANGPTNDDTWRVGVRNDTGSPIYVRINLFCARTD